MARPLKSDEIDSFALLSEIASFTTLHGVGGKSTELAIRTLEKLGNGGLQGDLLGGLLLQHGLYPYAIDVVKAESLRDAVLLEMNRPNPDSETIFHRVQSQVFHRLLDGENVILSAPTSFGKSVIIDALIQSGRYTNLVLLVPTIALLDETRRRLSRFRDYKVITHPSQQLGEKNILVMTQERLLSVPKLPSIDFFFIDEFYKLGDEQEGSLDARASMLNQAFLRLTQTGAQFYFAGPVVEGLVASLPANLQASFVRTDFSTVAADTTHLKASNDNERLARTAKLIGANCEPTLVYCQSPGKIRKVLDSLIETRSGRASSAQGMPEVAEWIEQNYHPEWVVAEALRLGIGVHHGRLPRWLAQRMVQGFESGELDVLVCTNSLIEGVNTRAKRIIIFDRNIANKAYNYFTFANICGRAGRMFKHFVGEIFLFHEPPSRELPEIDIPGVTQSEIAPSSLLVQIDESDWTPDTRERIGPVVEESRLGLELLRQVKGVEPEAAATLANYLRNLPQSKLTELQWSTPFPKWNQLLFACELIWDFIPPAYHRRRGAFSAKHLAFLINRAALVEGQMKEIIRLFVDDEKRQAESVDERIESAFEFVRFWIDHNLPNALRALGVIVNAVLREKRMAVGSFEGYAARTESMFSAPHLVTIEEYGLPLEVSRRLVRSAGAVRTLDEMLEVISAAAGVRQSALTRFENSLLSDFVHSI